MSKKKEGTTEWPTRCCFIPSNIIRFTLTFHSQQAFCHPRCGPPLLTALAILALMSGHFA